MWKGSTLTSSIVLVIMDELRNGAEQVPLCQVKCGLLCFCLSDLVMLHSWILFPIRPAGNKGMFLCKKNQAKFRNYIFVCFSCSLKLKSNAIAIVTSFKLVKECCSMMAARPSHLQHDCHSLAELLQHFNSVHALQALDLIEIRGLTPRKGGPSPHPNRRSTPNGASLPPRWHQPCTPGEAARRGGGEEEVGRRGINRPLDPARPGVPQTHPYIHT